MFAVVDDAIMGSSSLQTMRNKQMILPARHTRRQFIHGIPDGSRIRSIV